MRPLTEREIRASLVNCTKGEAQRLAVPKGLDTVAWSDLDFFGWSAPSAPEQAYLVADVGDRLHGGAVDVPASGLVGVALRAAPQTGGARRSMCSLCLTTHAGTGVALMTARRAGPTGRQGNSVGAYICTDLACSLYVRGKKDSGRRMNESLTQAEQIERTRDNLLAFLEKVLG